MVYTLTLDIHHNVGRLAMEYHGKEVDQPGTSNRLCDVSPFFCWFCCLSLATLAHFKSVPSCSRPENRMIRLPLLPGPAEVELSHCVCSALHTSTLLIGWSEVCFVSPSVCQHLGILWDTNVRTGYLNRERELKYPAHIFHTPILLCNECMTLWRTEIICGVHKQLFKGLLKY